MKKLRYLVTILFFAMILGGMSSCVVRHHHSDNGRHRGWYQRHHQVRPHQRTKVVIFKENRGNGSHYKKAKKSHRR